MTLRLTAFRPPMISLQAVLNLLGTVMPVRHPPMPDEDLFGHLERLARLSPHLLSDLGFRKEGRTGHCSQSTWRRGDLRVSVGDDLSTVSVCIDERSA